MDELTKFLNGGITSFRRAAAVNGIVNGSYDIDEGAGNERLQLDDRRSVSGPTDDDRFVATTPALGGINPIYLAGGGVILAYLLLRK